MENYNNVNDMKYVENSLDIIIPILKNKKFDNEIDCLIFGYLIGYLSSTMKKENEIRINRKYVY